MLLSGKLFTALTNKTMKLKDGQFYYARLRRGYAVYQHHDSGDGHSYGDKIVDNLSLTEAQSRAGFLNKEQLNK